MLCVLWSIAELRLLLLRRDNMNILSALGIAYLSANVN